MTKVIQLEDGSKYVASYKDDILLYEAPHNPPNTGSRYTRGRDLLAHKTRKHGYQFYTYYWSMWQGEESYYESCTREQAIALIIEHSEDLGGNERDNIKEVGLGEAIEEDA